RRRGVRVLLEKVVLHLPGVVDAEPVGELDLVKRLLVDAQLVAIGPGPRDLVLVENAKLHDAISQENSSWPGMTVLVIPPPSLSPAPLRRMPRGCAGSAPPPGRAWPGASGCRARCA